MENFAVATAFEHDHRAIDEVLERARQRLERGEWPGDLFSEASEDLRRHIYVEEEVLFPRLRAPNLFAAVFVMLREHAEIWRGLDAIEGAKGDPARALAALASLEPVLSAHNSKEEQILYPASEPALSAEDVAAVKNAFEEGTRPDDWVPKNLRAK